MTWLELYNLLYDRANTMSKLGTVRWNDEIIVHDASTGEENSVDIWELSESIEGDNESRLTLVYNQLEYESEGESK